MSKRLPCGWPGGVTIICQDVWLARIIRTEGGGGDRYEAEMRVVLDYVLTDGTRVAGQHDFSVPLAAVTRVVQVAGDTRPRCRQCGQALTPRDERGLCFDCAWAQAHLKEPT